MAMTTVKTGLGLVMNWSRNCKKPHKTDMNQLTSVRSSF